MAIMTAFLLRTCVEAEIKIARTLDMVAYTHRARHHPSTSNRTPSRHMPQSDLYVYTNLLIKPVIMCFDIFLRIDKLKAIASQEVRDKFVNLGE